MTLLRLASAPDLRLASQRHRNYRLFFAGQLTSVAGTWMQNIAMAWLVVQLAPHSRGLAVGMLSSAASARSRCSASSPASSPTGFDNRRTVIVTQSVQMFFSAVLAVITLVGHVQLWEVYAIAALTGTALVFDAPARQNLTFQMVGRDELPNAVALNSSLFNTARIFGPALAGVLIAAVGAGWCFAINTRQLPRRARRPARDARARALPARRPAAPDALARHARGLRVRAPQPNRAR